MSSRVEKTVLDVARELGRYPLPAFEFLQLGLDHSVRKRHGPPPPEVRVLAEWMEAEGVPLERLARRVTQGRAPAAVKEAIRGLGGVEEAVRRLNRHVGGVELAWGLRELALHQWGLLASTVLRRWGVTSTRDFGRMVFALVNNGLLQKQDNDRVEDFDDVYDFDRAFDGSYEVVLCEPGVKEETV